MIWKRKDGAPPKGTAKQGIEAGKSQNVLRSPAGEGQAKDTGGQAQKSGCF